MMDRDPGPNLTVGRQAASQLSAAPAEGKELEHVSHVLKFPAEGKELEHVSQLGTQ
jgi:hypothetical protein